MSAFDLITIHNSALALIDHQPATSLDAFSMDKTVLVNNTVAVAKLARAYGIPTVLTTITAATVGNIYPGVQAQFPDQAPIDRTDTNAWADQRFREAMVGTGRKKLVMAGLWTEVCLAYTVLSARADGYEVYFVEDASAGVSEAAHRMAIQRMILCGAQPVNWVGLMSEWNRSVAPQRAGAVMAVVGEIALTHAQNIGQRYAYGMQLAPEKLGARPQPVAETAFVH